MGIVNPLPNHRAISLRCRLGFHSFSRVTYRAGESVWRKQKCRRCGYSKDWVKL